MHPTCRARVRVEEAAAPAAAAAATAAATGQPTENRPSLDEIMGSRRPTLKHIPRACRDLWSTALAAALAAAHLATVGLGPSPSAEAIASCVAAWTDVLLLAKSVLDPSKIDPDFTWDDAGLGAVAAQYNPCVSSYKVGGGGSPTS